MTGLSRSSSFHCTDSLYWVKKQKHVTATETRTIFWITPICFAESLQYADGDTLLLFWNINSYLLSGEIGFRFFPGMIDCWQKNHFLKSKLLHCPILTFTAIFSDASLAKQLDIATRSYSTKFTVKKLCYNSCDITFVYKYCTNRQGIRRVQVVLFRLVLREWRERKPRKKN